MKNHTLKLAVILFSFSLANHVTAETLNNATVKSISIDTADSSSKAAVIVGVFGFFTISSDPLYCDGDDVFRLKNDAYFFDEIYSMVLSAKFSKSEVNLEVSGTAPDDCLIDNIEMDNL